MYYKAFKLLFSALLIAIFAPNLLGVDMRAEIEVSDLQASTGSKYEVAKNLQVGDKEYTDRNYTFTSLPDYLQGLTWIRTANNDKKNEKIEISFKIDRSAYVYILWIARDPADQKWLKKDYTKIDGEVGSTDESLSVFKSNKPFPKGLVTTYQAATNAGMYVIVLESVETNMSVNPFAKKATVWGKLKQ